MVELNARGNEKRFLLAEVGIVLLLFFVPRLWSTISPGVAPSRIQSLPSFLYEVTVIVSSLSDLVPVLFIAWCSGEGLARFRLKTGHWGAVVGYSFGLLLCFGFLGTLDTSVPPVWSASARTHLQLSAGFFLPWFLATIVWAMMRQFIEQGFLLTRFEDATRCWWAAILLSAVLYTCIEPWTRWQAVPVQLAEGVLYAGAARLSGSIWPGVIVRSIIIIGPVLMLVYG